MNVVSLMDICSPKQWKTISTKDLLENGFPVYGANGKIGFYSEYTHEEETILITCRGATCGKINICEPKSYVNGNAMALDKLSEDVDLTFLKYILIARGFQDVISGSAQPQITRTNLSVVKIPLPDLPTQKRIAKILDDAQALKQKNETLLQEYDTLAQSIFLDMFGDSWINPSNYKLVKLSDITNSGKIITYGIVQAGEQVDDGVPYIRTGDLKKGKILVNKLRRTSNEIAKSYERSKCSSGDIIMSIRATVGTIAILPKELDGCNLTQGTARISADSRIVNSKYLFHCINSKGVQLKIDRQTKGATFKEITLGRLRDIEIPLPSMILQTQFAEKIALIEKQKELAKKELQESEDLFNCLLQKAFKGEL